MHKYENPGSYNVTLEVTAKVKGEIVYFTVTNPVYVAINNNYLNGSFVNLQETGLTGEEISFRVTSNDASAYEVVFGNGYRWPAFSPCHPASLLTQVVN